MYVVGFAPLIILEIMLLPRCVVICVHLGLKHVRCWFCPANHSCNCVFAPVHCSLCSFGPRVCTLLVLQWCIVLCVYLGLVYVICWFFPLIILEIVFLPRCVVICVHLGLVYVRCWFCPANHSCNNVFALVDCSLCSFGTHVCTLLVSPC
jgi:hypothetical protein